jgi:hypothetical protein
MNVAPTNRTIQINQPERGATVHQPRVSAGSREGQLEDAGAYLEVTGGQHVPGRQGPQPETNDACPPTDRIGDGRPTPPQYDVRGQS